MTPLLALAASALALLLAVVALAVAWRANSRAADARDLAATGRGGTTVPSGQPVAPKPPAPEPPAEPPPTPEDPGVTGEPPPLNERTNYTVKYTKQKLTLKAGCSGRMWADLDEPRANVQSSGADMELVGGCTTQPAALRLGEDVAASEAAEPAMTPFDCADKIRTAPVGTDAAVGVRKGVVMCLTTSYSAARERNDVQRMVLLEITGTTGDGAVTLEVSAWNIPR